MIDDDLDDLTPEEAAELRARANVPEPGAPKPTRTIDDIMAMIQALPDLGIVPREQLAPVLDAIAATEPLVRDQLVTVLRTKVRKSIKAATIDEEIASRCGVVPDGDDSEASDEDNGDESNEITDEAIARMTRRCMADGRPAIFCDNNESTAVDDAIEALTKRAPWIFMRDGKLVQVRKAQIIELTVDNVRYALNRVATFVDASGFKLKLVKGVPIYVTEMVRARGFYPKMRELAGVATTPILHADGSVFMTPGGYDATTKQVYIPAHNYPALPEAPPSLAEAQAAAAEVLEMFVDFPVREACDRAAILALVITLVGRPVVDGPVPGFLVSANAPRVGKGKVVETAAAIAYGTKTPIIPQQKSDEELEKKLTAYFRKGRRLIAFDNLTQFGGPIIDALLTARQWDGRLLGTSEIGTYDIGDLVVTATANNARLLGDAAQRVLPIRLHTDDPHPEKRTGWKRALPDDAIADHVRLHIAALTVLRYGLTLTGPVAAWGSFEAWCRVIRRIVSAVLGVDPCDTRTADAAVDETAQTLVMLLTAINGLGAGREWSGTALLEKARGKRGKSQDGNADVWIEPPDEPLNEALGNLLGDHKRVPHNVGGVLNPHKGRPVVLGDGSIAALNSRLLNGVTLWWVVITPAASPTGGGGPDDVPAPPTEVEPRFDESPLEVGL